MNDLIAEFNRVTALTVVNPTPYALVLQYGGVYSESYIPKGTVLGEVFGTQAYIWEIDHGDYMMVDQDYVLDTSELKAPRSILTFVREENSTNNMANCTIVTTDGPRFFLQTTSDIPIGAEVVYFILGHMYI